MARKSDILVPRLMRTLGEQARLERTVGEIADALCTQLKEEVPGQPEIDLTQPRISDMAVQRIALTGIATSFDDPNQLLRSPEATQQADQIVRKLRLGTAVLALCEPDNPQDYRLGKLKSATIHPDKSSTGLDVDMTMANARREVSYVTTPLGTILAPRMARPPPFTDPDLYLGQETISIIDLMYNGAADEKEAGRHHVLSKALARSGFRLTALGYSRAEVDDKRFQIRAYFESPNDTPYSGHALRLLPFGMVPLTALGKAIKLGKTYPQLKPEENDIGTLGHDITFLRSMSNSTT